MNRLLATFFIFVILFGCTTEKPMYNSTDYYPQNNTQEENQIIDNETIQEVDDDLENDSHQGEPTIINEVVEEEDQTIPSCGDDRELFNVSLVDLDKIYSISPLGGVNPPGHTFPTQHIYLHLNEIEVPLYAPGDVWITGISHSGHVWDPEGSDYSIDFSPCSEFKGYFLHVKTISEKLQNEFKEPYAWCQEYETGGYEYKLCGKDVMIKLEAGELIGTVGNEKQGNFDFGAYDLRTPELEFINKERLYEDRLHIVCGLDYFTPELKEELKSKLGYAETKRTIEPVCGEVEQDEPGTAQGLWFVKGVDHTQMHAGEDEHLALVHDSIDPIIGVFSIGTSMQDKGLQSSTYYFDPEHFGFINRDFDGVTSDGNVYCYETYNKFNENEIAAVIVMKLYDKETLWIEKKNWENCNQGNFEFGSKYGEFVR